MSHIGNKRLPWQHLRIRSIVNVCKICLKSVKLKMQNVILLSCGNLELLRKTPGGEGGIAIRLPGIDSVMATK